MYLSVNRSGENGINRLHRNFLSLPYSRNQHSSLKTNQEPHYNDLNYCDYLKILLLATLSSLSKLIAFLVLINRVGLQMLLKKELKVISLDLPTSHLAFSSHITDEFTYSMMKAINSMMMDMSAAVGCYCQKGLSRSSSPTSGRD